MSTLRLPLIGDFIYVSRVGVPDAERKYVVTTEVDDGYHMVPEGMDPVNNTSMIKYKFASKKWVVHGAEDAFNVRIQLNPELYETELELDLRIQESIDQGRFDEAKRLADRFRSISDLNMVSTRSDPEEELDLSLYDSFMSSPNRTNIFDWLEKNYFVDYPKYLREASQYSNREVADALEPLEWLSARAIDWSKYRHRADFDWASDVVADAVVSEDRDDTFRILMSMPGLIDTLEETMHGRTFVEAAERDGSNKVLELLRTVPTKGVQVKHLQ